MREATSVVLINDLLARGATVAAYDPVAVAEAKRVFGDRAGLTYVTDAKSALAQAHALVVVTEWKEFARFDPAHIKELLQPLAAVFDGRSLFTPNSRAQFGVEYASIGGGIG